MDIIVQDSEIKLIDGFKIKPTDSGRGYFPPLKDVHRAEYACDICPIWEVCEGNNEFDCQVYGMFSGANFYLDDLIKICIEARRYREVSNKDKYGRDIAVKGDK